MAKIPYVDLTDTVNTHRLRTNQLIDSVGDLALLTTDSNASLVAAINSVDSNQGDRVDLNTKHGSDLVDAINSVLEMLDSDLGKPFTNLNSKDKATVIDAINSVLAMHESDMGSLASLNTKEGSTIVAAINSAVAMQESDLGTLSSLTTKQKSTVVAAINSVQAERDSDLGNLSSLTTDVKGTIVGAINSLVTNRGTMGSLQTSATNNLVAAINELKFRVDLLDSDVEINLDSAFSAIALGDSAVRAYALSLADSNYTYLVNRIVTGDAAVQANVDSDRLDYIARDDSDRADILARFAAADTTLRNLIDSNTDNFTTNVRSKLTAGTGLTYTQGTGEFKLTNISPAIPSGTYGSNTAIPVLTINARGQVTSASTATVAGIDSVGFDNATGVFTIYTADGDSYSNVLGIGANTTDDLTEGNTNLYYTKARVDSDITDKVIKSYIDQLDVDADTLDDQDGTYYLDYNNFTNTPTINDAIIAIANDGFLTGTGSWTANEADPTSVTIGHPVSGVTAATYGQTGTENGQYIKSIGVDSRGHISSITADDFDDRYDKYTGWYVRGDATSNGQVTSSRVLQFEGGDYVSTTLDTSGNPWKLTIAVNTNVGGQLLIKNSAGTTLKTILGITTSV